MAKKEGGTPWSIFIWAVGIVSVLLAGLFWRVEGVRSDVGTLTVDTALIRSDVGWIKQMLEKQTARNQ